MLPIPFDDNTVLKMDGYKPGQVYQYPPGTKALGSYLESREGAEFEETVFFGLQTILLRHFVGEVITRKMIDDAELFLSVYTPNARFNRAGWEYIIDVHGGRLPVEIRAVAEGTPVNTSNALMTVKETDPNCAWVVNPLETMLVQVWYPCTVATLSREIKKLLAAGLLDTGSNLDALPFMLHDFGFRGVGSFENAAIGGSAHLVNFLGSDTLPGIGLLEAFYSPTTLDGMGLAAYSVPASEHSTMTTWGQEREVDAYRNMLEAFPTGIVSVVSDSYDIFYACQHIWGGELKDLVVKRGEAGGRLVIRPDSGHPPSVIPKLLRILAGQFGTTTNFKGFKVLPSYLRILQGDGIDLRMVEMIITAVKAAGYAVENLVFGSGGGLLQKMNRDTQRFAFKASYTENEFAPEGMDVFKHPVGDARKNSKKGLLKLVSHVQGRYTTVPQTAFPTEEDLLVPVFRNGELLVRHSLVDVRRRARIREEVLAEAGVAA